MSASDEKKEARAGGDGRLLARLGRYQLERRIGAGGMAEVFLARAEGPGGFEKQVVVKRIRPELAANQRFIEMFLREARVLARLDHPNIVRIIEFDEQNGEYFLALEYLQGLPLRDIVERSCAVGRPLPLETILLIMADAALGLEHAHRFRDVQGRPAELVHRDVSPDNLFVTTTGLVKVLDFGIAKAAGVDDITQTGELKGKIPYMSPEQLMGYTLDGRSDLWSMGIILQWMLSGRKPFQADGDLPTIKAILEDARPSIRSVNPRVPLVVDQLVAALLERDRTRRLQSAATLHDALMTLLAALSGTPLTPAKLVAAAERLPPVTEDVKPPGLAAVPMLAWREELEGSSVDAADAATQVRPPREGGTQSLLLVSAEEDPSGQASGPQSEPSPASDLEDATRLAEPFAMASSPSRTMEAESRVESDAPFAGDVDDRPDLERFARLSQGPFAGLRPTLPDNPTPDASPYPSPPLSSPTSDSIPAVRSQRTLPLIAGWVTALLVIAALWQSGALARIFARPSTKVRFVEPTGSPLPASLDPGQGPSGFGSGAERAPTEAGSVRSSAPTSVEPSPELPPRSETAPKPKPRPSVSPPPPPPADVETRSDATDDGAGGDAETDAEESRGVRTGPRRRAVDVSGPRGVQWQGPGGEVYGAGTATIRVPESVRSLVAVDVRRGGRTRIPLERGEKIDYEKLPRQQLIIRVRPYAEVFLGRQSLGVTPLEPLQLVAGTYEVKLVYDTTVKTVSVEVTADKPAVLNVNMTK